MTRRWIATACTTFATAACVAMPATAAAVTSAEFPIETSNDNPIYITEIGWAISVRPERNLRCVSRRAHRMLAADPGRYMA